jgi:gentisate 1,2-dioxygenase
MADTQLQDKFHAGMTAAGVRALWERTTHDPREPVSEPPYVWRWAEIEPLIDQAVAATSMDTAERRVLSLANPYFNSPRGNCVTTNLNCGIQTLMPGETARVHRHTANALRFVLEGGGGTTVVDGKPCPMRRGDLIVTPGMAWHSHTHEGDARIVWMDSLDVPLHRYLDTQFFDPGPAGNYPPLPPDAAYGQGGLVPQPEPGEALPSYSPQFRYGWDEACAALAAMRPRGDASKVLRYTNPATGGPAMALFDCYLVALAKGQATRAFRATSNAYCLVVEGEGRSVIGDVAIAWQRNDIFTLPHWNWYSHTATGGEGARLFMGTDREVLRRLELLREEWAD